MGLACDQVFVMDGMDTFGLTTCHALLVTFFLHAVHFFLTGEELAVLTGAAYRP